MIELFLFSTGQTTNINDHLFQIHKLRESSDDTPSPRQSQPTIDFFTKKDNHPPLGNVKQAKILNKISWFVIDGLHSLSIIEEKGFRNLLTELEPRYKPACRKTLRSKICSLYDDEEKLLKETLSLTEFVNLTHDSWTSRATDQYDTLLAHYIARPAWSFETKVLQTTKSDGKKKVFKITVPYLFSRLQYHIFNIHRKGLFYVLRL